MYITYDEYLAGGGIVKDIAAFNLLERRARYKLDFYTQNRIKQIGIVAEYVKDCMAGMIDLLSLQGTGDKVASFSNDGVSVSFEKQNEEQRLYTLATEMLPAELLYLGAE